MWRAGCWGESVLVSGRGRRVEGESVFFSDILVHVEVVGWLLAFLDEYFLHLVGFVFRSCLN